MEIDDEAETEFEEAQVSEDFQLVDRCDLILRFEIEDQVTAIDKLKVLTYLRLLKLRLGLIINFHVSVLKDGIFRVVNNLIERLRPEDEEPPDLHG